MGNQFCCVSNSKNSEFSSSKTIGQITYKSNNFKLIYFNIEKNKIISLKVNLRILTSLKGISQINSEEGYIYLCGNNNDSILPNLLFGSYLIKLKIKENNIDTQLLINSRSPHYNPSLILNKKYLFVIGGKKQTKCELYNLELNKWKEVRNLPEERYKCSLLIDRNNEYLYCFGGVYTKNKFEGNYSILKLNINKVLYQWERIMINENYNLLYRYSAACFKNNDSNFIYIIGGKNVSFNQKNNNKLLNDVIIYDCFCKVIKSSNIKLQKECKFQNKYGLCFHQNQFFFIDSESNVHFINLETKQSDILQLKEEKNSYLNTV